MSRLLRGLRALWFVLVLALPAAALAQDESAAESRAATFEAARGAQLEEIPGGGLLVAAYGAALVLLLVYVVSMAFRQASTARELERLKNDLAAHAGKPATAKPAEES